MRYLLLLMTLWPAVAAEMEPTTPLRRRRMTDDGKRHGKSTKSENRRQYLNQQGISSSSSNMAALIDSQMVVQGVSLSRPTTLTPASTSTGVGASGSNDDTPAPTHCGPNNSGGMDSVHEVPTRAPYQTLRPTIIANADIPDLITGSQMSMPTAAPATSTPMPTTVRITCFSLL